MIKLKNIESLVRLVGKKMTYKNEMRLKRISRLQVIWSFHWNENLYYLLDQDEKVIISGKEDEVKHQLLSWTLLRGYDVK